MGVIMNGVREYASEVAPTKEQKGIRRKDEKYKMSKIRILTNLCPGVLGHTSATLLTRGRVCSGWRESKRTTIVVFLK